MDSFEGDSDDDYQQERGQGERAKRRAQLIQAPPLQRKQRSRPSAGSTIDGDGDTVLETTPASATSSRSSRKRASSGAVTPTKKPSHGGMPTRNTPNTGDFNPSPDNRSDAARRATPKSAPADLSLCKLRRLGTSGNAAKDYWDVDTLSATKKDRLQQWWLLWQNGKDAWAQDVRGWFTDLLGYEKQCCGSKLVTRHDSDWKSEDDGNFYACPSCRSKKVQLKRPCLRLVINDSGEKIIEVLPEAGKGSFEEAGTAYDYWDAPSGGSTIRTVTSQ